jgi:D-serine deaminase-like pyridoxal phosphate-dependent protein
VRSIERRPGLSFAGVLGYEAHIAGIADRSRAGPLVDLAMRTMKRLAREAVLRNRAAIVHALAQAGYRVPLFNGGGTGSTEFSATDPSLTEITIGSGFVDSHLFDGFDGLELEPAAYFALQVTRVPGPGFVTCHSGGFVASGGGGRDRLPRPVLPPGLTMLDREGAGEVQTPLRLPEGAELPLGAPVFFRHAKAGELGEHFDEYLLVRGAVLEGRAKTYRGRGAAFH